MLSLGFRLISQYICLLFIRILSIIDLVCCFHVSCVSKWSPRYLTCFVCVMCVPFSRMFGGIYLRRQCVYSVYSVYSIYRVYRVYRVYNVYSVYRVYRVYVIYSVYSVYRVYRVYRLYIIYSVYSVYSVYNVYRVYSIYNVYSVYRVYKVYSIYIVYIIYSVYSGSGSRDLLYAYDNSLKLLRMVPSQMFSSSDMPDCVSIFKLTFVK